MPPTRPDFTTAELRRILAGERENCPAARLTDLYKLLHQAHYGPTHAPDDPAALARGLREELKRIGEHSGTFFQDIGCGKGFIRVNLIALVTMKSLPLNRYSSFSDFLSQRFRAVPAGRIQILVHSLLASRLPDGIDWQDWNRIWSDALPLALEFVQPESGELEAISTCLREHNMPSHSQAYRDACNPHYRVIWHTELPHFVIPGLTRDPVFSEYDPNNRF